MLEYDLILKKKKSELFSDAIYQSGASSVFRKTGSDRKRPIHTFLQTGSSRKNQNDSFLGRIPGLWRVHSSHPFLKPHTWLISVEFTIWLQFCSQCQFPPTNHKSLTYHLFTELGLEGENDRGSLTRHTGGQAISHGGHLAQRAIAWMSLLSPQDAHYTRLTTKAWLTLGNMITRMKRSDETWVKHEQRFLLRSTISPNQRKGIFWWIKAQYSDRSPQGPVKCDARVFQPLWKIGFKAGGAFVPHSSLVVLLCNLKLPWCWQAFLIMASNNSEDF